MNLQSFVDRLIPDAGECQAAADALREGHPDLLPLELAQIAIRSARLRGAMAGAATGAASNPVLMVPAALADMAALLRLEGMLVGTIGALLDPQAMGNSHQIKADVISVVFPAAASQALRQVGIRAGEQFTQAMVRKYATEDLVRTIARLATRYLGKEVTREAITRKAVPMIGMGIGAGWNWLEVKTIGNRAIRYYTHQPIGISLSKPALMGKAAVEKWWPKVKGLLPGKKQ